MIVLVLGGTRSGKSAVAEGLAGATDAPVTYLATATVDAGDAEHVERVARHRARRPSGWATIECRRPADLLTHLSDEQDTVLVDSLGTWLAGRPDMAVDVSGLLSVLRGRSATTILVSEEVGLAVHPTTPAGRRFVDALGELNQAVAAVADRVILVVAGRALDLPGPVPGVP
jgi:adenosyl cobinamide kinase/adenosyl cobinamide phosphate guanylyltransferase